MIGEYATAGWMVGAVLDAQEGTASKSRAPILQIIVSLCWLLHDGLLGAGLLPKSNPSSPAGSGEFEMQPADSQPSDAVMKAVVYSSTQSIYYAGLTLLTKIVAHAVHAREDEQMDVVRVFVNGLRSSEPEQLRICLKGICACAIEFPHLVANVAADVLKLLATVAQQQPADTLEVFTCLIPLLVFCPCVCCVS